MKEINLIKKDTIIPKVKPLDWDVEIKGRPYYVVRLKGFIHTIGGKWGENEFWAYPRDEEPCYDCLAEPVNQYSHKPVKYEEDTRVKKQPENNPEEEGDK